MFARYGDQAARLFAPNHHADPDVDGHRLPPKFISDHVIEVDRADGFDGEAPAIPSVDDLIQTEMIGGIVSSDPGAEMMRDVCAELTKNPAGTLREFEECLIDRNGNDVIRLWCRPVPRSTLIPTLRRMINASCQDRDAYEVLTRCMEAFTQHPEETGWSAAASNFTVSHGNHGFALLIELIDMMFPPGSLAGSHDFPPWLGAVTPLWPHDPDAPRVPKIVKELCTRLVDTKTVDGLIRLQKLKNTFAPCAKTWMIIRYDLHANDHRDFRKIDCTPHAVELTDGMQVDLANVAHLRFTTAPDSLYTHLNRQFRLVRKDALIPLREAYAVVNRLDSKKPLRTYGQDIRRITPAALERATYRLCQDGITLFLTGTVSITLSPGLDRRVNFKKRKEVENWLEESRGVFSHGTAVFIRDQLSSNTLIGTVSRPKEGSMLVKCDVVKDPRAFVPGKKAKNPPPPKNEPVPQVVNLTLRFEVENVPVGTVPCTEGACTAYASRVDLVSTSCILESLRNIRRTPFEDTIITRREAIRNVRDLDRPVIRQGRYTERQRDAIVSALEREVTIVQGPPGTGKTFVAVEVCRVLLLLRGMLHREDSSLVVIMAHTNHALDQLLCRVNRAMVDEPRFEQHVLRLGGGSKDDFVKEHFMNKDPLDGKLPGATFKDCKQKIERRKAHLLALLQPDKKLFELCTRRISWFRRFQSIPELALRDDGFSSFNIWIKGSSFQTHIWKKLQGPDEKNKVPVFTYWKGPERRQRLIELLGKILGPCPSSAPAHDFRSRPNGNGPDPRRDHEILAQAGTAPDMKDIARAAEDLRAAKDEQTKHRDRARATDARNRGFQLIGMTTTFAAVNPALVRALLDGSSLVVEESAEILEARVLAAIGGCAALRRMLLIGDHKQLPPKVNSFAMESGHSKSNGARLDVSLFERLVVGDRALPYFALDEQHRMFPLLARIVRDLSYPELRDAADVPRDGVPIPSLRRQLAFVDHDFKEGGPEDDDLSKVNPREAKAVVELIAHLVRQGVAAERIATLTPYLGQVRELRSQLNRHDGLAGALGDRDAAEMSSDSDEEEEGDANPVGRPNPQQQHQQQQRRASVRISTIDNYQGEENDYIIISLVRCNDRGNIGWLVKPQRLTVLLSRAKRGLVIFGNRDTMLGGNRGAGASPWLTVFRHLDECNAVHKGLEFQCQRHRDEPPILKTPEELLTLSSPATVFCGADCRQMMPCGHRCPAKCHGNAPHKPCALPIPVQCRDPNHLPHTVPCHTKRTFEHNEFRDSCGACKALRELGKAHQKVWLAARDRLKINLAKVERTIMKPHDDAVKEAQGKFNEADSKWKATFNPALKPAAEEERARADRELALQKLRKRQAEDLARSDTGEVGRHRLEMDAELDELTRKQELEEAEHQEQFRALKHQADAAAAEAVDAVREHVQRRAAVEAVVAAVTPAELQRQVVCCICQDEDERKRACDMVACHNGKHFSHQDCFANMVQHHLGHPDPQLKGYIPCEYCRNEKAENFIIPLHRLAMFVDEELFERAHKQLMAVREAEVEAETQKRVEERHAKDAQASEGELFRRCQEQMVDLCPGCNRPFVYDGCAAVTCNCKCHFCALCLTNTGGDAHTHVALCHLNPQRGNHFVGQQELLRIREAQWRIRNLELIGMHPEKTVRDRVWRRLYPQRNEDFPQ